MEVGDFKVIGGFRVGKLFNLNFFNYNTAFIPRQERAAILAHKKDSGQARKIPRPPASHPKIKDLEKVRYVCAADFQP